ncbi:fibronectin type III domain-containing protein [Microbacterium sp.]|uniref:fibronectin type III domain-containing protein n=1 Tax=Microbacterium sp. TaxID=51671 RepID=UPI003735A84B
MSTLTSLRQPQRSRPNGRLSLVALTVAVSLLAPMPAAASAPAADGFTARPSAVTEVKAVDAQWTSKGASVTFDWPDAQRAAKYDVYLSTDYDGIVHMTSPTTSVTASKVTLTGLKGDTSYTVRVNATNSKGRGVTSPRTVHKTVNADDAGYPWYPTRPDGVGTVVFTDTSWSAKTGATLSMDWPDVARATAYEVFVSTSFDGIVDMTVPTVTVRSSAAKVTGLKPGTKYTVRVAATNSISRGSYSARVKQTTATELTGGSGWQTSRPGTVGLLTFTGASLTPKGATLTVDWDDVPNATSYVVFASTSYNGLLNVTKPAVTVTASEATITGLKKGTNYFVRVAAANNVGRGPASARVGHATIAGEAKIAPGTAEYSLATWNVCSNVCANWGTRKGIIDRQIREMAPNIIALQEASKYTKAPAGYAFVVNDQNDILVRKGVFGKVAANKKGKTTGSATFASKHSEAGHGVDWAALRHRSGRYMVVFNAHLTTGTTKAQIKQREYEASKLADIVGSTMRALGTSHGTNLRNASVAILGDINTSKSTGGDATLSVLKKRGWYDAFDQARSLTRQHHNSANPDLLTTPVLGVTWGAQVDKVLVKPSRTVVTSWAHAGKMNGKNYATPLASDHFPILVKGYFR